MNNVGLVFIFLSCFFSQSLFGEEVLPFSKLFYLKTDIMLDGGSMIYDFKSDGERRVLLVIKQNYNDRIKKKPPILQILVFGTQQNKPTETYYPKISEFDKIKKIINESVASDDSQVKRKRNELQGLLNFIDDKQKKIIQ
jgi:hypothetical protein